VKFPKDMMTLHCNVDRNHPARFLDYALVALKGMICKVPVSDAEPMF